MVVLKLKFANNLVPPTARGGGKMFRRLRPAVQWVLGSHHYCPVR